MPHRTAVPDHDRFPPVPAAAAGVFWPATKVSFAVRTSHLDITNGKQVGQYAVKQRQNVLRMQSDYNK